MSRYIDADKIQYKNGIVTRIAIEEMPTAYVKPIEYGEWNPNFQEVEDVKTGETWLETTSYHCSVCNDGYVEEKRNFCPNCGADMRKEGEEEE